MKNNLKEIITKNVLEKHKFFKTFEYQVLLKIGKNKLEIIMFNELNGKFVSKWYYVPKITEENKEEYRKVVLEVMSDYVTQVMVI